MPQLDDLEASRLICARQSDSLVYIILLMMKDGKTNIVQGFETGVIDYVVKLFDRSELLARVKVGGIVVGLQQKIAEKVKTSKMRSRRSNNCRVFCRSVPTASTSAMTRITGNESKHISASVRKPSSVTAFVQIVMTE